MEDFATHPHGVTISVRGAGGLWTEHGNALIAADGLWSASRARIASKDPPRFAGRTAWRALLPATQVAPEFREPLVGAPAPTPPVSQAPQAAYWGLARTDALGFER